MTDHNNLTERILEKIKGESLTPRPKWLFAAKNLFWWAGGAFFLLATASSGAMVFFLWRHDQLDFYRHAHGHPLELFWTLVPFFWLFCIAVFLVLVYYYFKRPKKGYRYSRAMIIGAGALGAILIGAFFHFFNFSQPLDDFLGRQAPFYDRVINPRVHFWSDPAQGRLAGLLIQEKAADSFGLLDQKKKEWTVLTGQMVFREGADLRIGESARFIGQISSTSIFTASEALPFGPGREFWRRPEFVPWAGRKLGDPVCPSGAQNSRGFVQEKAGYRPVFHPLVREALLEGLRDKSGMIREAWPNDPALVENLESLALPAELLEILRPE